MSLLISIYYFLQLSYLITYIEECFSMVNLIILIYFYNIRTTNLNQQMN